VIVLPNKCETFGDYSLGDIRNVSFSAENPFPTVCQTLIESSDGKKIVVSFGPEEKIVIDNQIEFLLDEYCHRCLNLCLSSYTSTNTVNGPYPLHEITFEYQSRLKCLGKWALSTTLLKAIQIPSGVEVIEKSCFNRCQSLCEVTFESESKLRRIEEDAFRDTALKTIQIPSSTESIGHRCFWNCKSLWEIVFESGSKLKCIEGSAFAWTSLKMIEIPKSVQSIGGYCFQRCYHLHKVVFALESELQCFRKDAFPVSALGAIKIPSGAVVVERLFWDL
jgi:hypothetical protein